MTRRSNTLRLPALLLAVSLLDGALLAAPEVVIDEDFEAGTGIDGNVIAPAQVLNPSLVYLRDTRDTGLLSLAQGANDQLGYAWFGSPVDLEPAGEATVTVEFDFWIRHGTSADPADGLCAIFHFDSDLTAAGGGGGDLGVCDLPGPSLSVCFDVWDNGATDPDGTPCADPTGGTRTCHVEVNQDSCPESDPSLATGVDVPDFVAIGDGLVPIHARIVIAGGALTVFLQTGGDPTFPSDVEVLSTTLGALPAVPTATFGFSGATGGANAHFEVDNVVVTRDAPPTPFTFERVDPPVHPIQGGTEIHFIGSDFPLDGSLSATIGGEPVAGLRVLNHRRAVGFAPALAPGTYDVTLFTGGSSAPGDSVTLTAGFDAADAKLPPVNDLTCEESPDGLALTWSNVVEGESINVLADGVVVAQLPGDATSFVYGGTGHGSGAAQTVHLSLEIDGGTAGGGGSLTSYEAGCDVGPIDCPPEVLIPTGMESDTTLHLPGRDSREHQTYFELDEAAPDGIRIRVHGRRLHPSGSLKARLREKQPPFDVIVDGIDINDLPVGSPKWTEGQLLAPLPAGLYVLGFYVEGGSELVDAYALSANDNLADPGDPCPCPPYPLAHVTPVPDNICPIIHGIYKVVLNPLFEDLLADEFKLDLQGDGGGAGGVPCGATGAVLTLAADVEDPDGTIIRYEWNFGDGTGAVTASPTVTHAFHDGGSFEVTVTAIDNGCCRSTETQNILVSLASACDFSAITPPTFLGISPNPATQRFIPDIAQFPVHRKWSAEVGTHATGEIASVGMKLVNPANPSEVYQSRACVKENPDDPDPAWWRPDAAFDMSALPRRTSVLLLLDATDKQGLTGTQSVEIPLCPLPQVFELPFVGTHIDYDKGAWFYDVEGSMPPDPLWEHTLDIPLPGDDLHLDNALDLRMVGRMALDGKKGHWLGHSLEGLAKLELLNIDLVNKKWSVENSEAIAFACPQFGVVYEKEFEILDKDFPPIVLFMGPIVSGKVIGVDVELWGTILAGFGIELTDDVLIKIQSGEPLVIENVLTPELEGSLTGEITLQIFNGLASLSAKVKAGASFALPVTLKLEGNDLSVDVDWCFGVDIDVGVKACVVVIICVSKTFNVYDNHWGPGCGDGGGGSIPLEDPLGPPPLKFPSIAASPDGKYTLMGFVKDVDDDPFVYDPELYYSLDDGNGWPVPVPFFDEGDDFVMMDLQVEFIGDELALATWTRNTLTPAEADVLAQTLSETDFSNAVQERQEIFYSLWDPFGGWSAPGQVTDDEIADGLSKLAAIPGQQAAWCAFARHDGGDVVQDGQFDLCGLSVHAARVHGNGAVDGMVKLSDDSGATLQPAVAVSPGGGAGICVWALDPDCDVNTSGDRVLGYSLWQGGAWGPAQVWAPGLPGGVLMPSIALSSDDDGVLIFTSRDVVEVDPDELQFALAGEGNADVAYTAELVDGVFEAPEKLTRGLCPGELPKLYVKYPKVKHVPGEGFVVAMRQFGDGPTALAGDLAIGTLVGDPSNRRFTVLSNIMKAEQTQHGTANRVREVDFAVANGRIRTVHESSAGPAAFGGLVLRDEAWAPDLALTNVRVSQPYALPGQEVTLTPTIRNVGLRGFPGGVTGPNTTLRFSVQGEDGEFSEVGALPLAFDLDPQEASSEYEWKYTVYRRAGFIRVSADAITGERSSEDNSIEIAIGVPPPAGLECAEGGTSARPRADLRWRNAAPYERILVYRGNRLLRVLRGDATSYADEYPPSAAGATWSVVGGIGEALSPPAACVLGPPTPPAPQFQRGDCNGDGAFNIADAVTTLLYLFDLGRLQDLPSCRDACDANDDGALNIADASRELDRLFRGAPPLPAPYRVCGTDSTADGLSCAAYDFCQ